MQCTGFKQEHVSLVSYKSLKLSVSDTLIATWRTHNNLKTNFLTHPTVKVWDSYACETSILWHVHYSTHSYEEPFHSQELHHNYDDQ